MGNLFSNLGSAVHNAVSSIASRIAPQAQKQATPQPPPPPPPQFRMQSSSIGTGFSQAPSPKLSVAPPAPVRLQAPPQQLQRVIPQPQRPPMLNITPQVLQKVNKGVNLFNSPTPNPSAQMNRVLPKPVSGPQPFIAQPANLKPQPGLTDFAVGAARSIPRAAMSAISTFTGKPYQAVDPASKFIYGSEPIKTGGQVRADISSFLSQHGLSPQAAGIASVPLAAGSIVSELFPFLGGGEKKALEEATTLARNSKDVNEFVNGMRTASEAGHAAYNSVLTNPSSNINTAADFYKAMKGGANVASDVLKTGEKTKNISSSILSKNTIQRSGTAKKIEESKAPSSSLASKADSHLEQTRQNPSSSSIPHDVNLKDEVRQYISKLDKEEKSARRGSSGDIVTKLTNVKNKIKSGFLDSTAPLVDPIRKADKDVRIGLEGKTTSLRPSDLLNRQIDKVFRSSSIATQFAKDNGLYNVIRQAPDLKNLERYLVAKRVLEVGGKGVETGRDLSKEEKIVKYFEPQYEKAAQQVYEYQKKLLDYTVKSGLLPKDLAESLKKESPSYVPLERIFNDLETTLKNSGITTKPIASLSKQTFLKKLVGSKRAIENPLESILHNTTIAFNQGERNKAAAMAAKSRELPGMKDLIKELPKGESAPHTFSYLDNGVKRTFETTPEIAAAAKSLNREQWNVWVKMLSYPTRLLRLGATGLNVPFIARNVIRDQATMLINSDKGLRTSIANPLVFGKALFSALKHDKLYEEAVREGALTTSFDIGREGPKLSLSAIRAGRSKTRYAVHLITHPSELLRQAEDIVGRSEELGRLQQYYGRSRIALQQGKSVEEARALGATAANWNTANFQRAGDVGRMLNVVIPYFNAGIQGGRTLGIGLKNRPVQTTTKLGLFVFTPIAAATLWNMSDPQRKKVYDDIQETDKRNNIVIVLNGSQKDNNGQYNVIKIPLSQEIANLGSIVRRQIELGGNISPSTIRDMAENLFGTASGISANTPLQAVGSFLPQGVKAPLETVLNKNLYTGAQIVPDKMKNFPPSAQAKPTTSGTARIVGDELNTSPLYVENAVKTSLGGLGTQLLNLSDSVLSKLGKIPSSQIGGENPGQATLKAFTKSSGGNTNKPITTQDLYNQLKSMPKDQRDKATQDMYKNDPTSYQALNEYAKVAKMTPDEQAIYQRASTNGDRAKYVLQQVSKYSDKTQKQQYIKSLYDHGVVNDANIKQIQDLVNKQKQTVTTQQVNKVVSVVPDNMKEAATKTIPTIIKELADNGITGTKQIAYALATAQGESGLNPKDEIGGANTKDAPYYGRGLVQLTGKANYATYGKAIGLGDKLVDNPELANDPTIAAKILVAFLKAHGTLDMAASGDFEGARSSVNGGYNGLDTVNKAYDQYLQALGG